MAMSKGSLGILIFLLYVLMTPIHAGSPEVRFFNWSDYLPEELLERFTAETGIRVRYSTYDSNEAMYAKIKLLQGKGYDLVMPSTYYVDKMRKEGLLQPLDKAQLPGFRNLDPRRLDQPFDPGNVYSVPYLWGTTGIAVNAAKIDPAQVRSWADLWRPEFRQSLLLPNDLREVFFVGLKVLGHSGNSTDPRQIRAAYSKLRELLPNVRLFNSDSPQMLYVTGEVDAGLIWNGNAYRAREEDPNLRYVYPKEGCQLWMDNLVIPKGAENLVNAHRLIDFLLRPEIAKQIAERLAYASPNAEAVKLMDAKLRNDPVIYPPDDWLENAEYTVDIGAAITLYAEYWERLKAGE
jgi:spermidine/putrescine transport system substrate-binding protein